MVCPLSPSALSWRSWWLLVSGRSADTFLEGKRKHLLKTKGIKISKGKGAKHNVK